MKGMYLKKYKEVTKMREKLKYIKKNWKNEWSLPLFIITFFYTIFIWGMVIVDAANKSFYTMDFLVRFYTIGLLPVYIGLRAGDRYRRVQWKKRPGEKSERGPEKRKGRQILLLVRCTPGGAEKRPKSAETDNTLFWLSSWFLSASCEVPQDYLF